MLPTSSRDPSLIQQPTHSPNPIYFTLIDGIIVNTPSHSFLFIHALDSSINLSMYSPLHSSLHSRISFILSYIHSLMSRVWGPDHIKHIRHDLNVRAGTSWYITGTLMYAFDEGAPRELTQSHYGACKLLSRSMHQQHRKS